jgi:hypothetical protein
LGAFGQTLDEEADARREVLGGPWGSACKDYQQPSAIPGLCAQCAHNEAEHRAEAWYRAARERAESIAGRVQAVLQVRDSYFVQIVWSEHLSPRRSDSGRRTPSPSAMIVSVKWSGKDIEPERWAKLVEAGLPIVPFEERVVAGAAATSEGPGDEGVDAEDVEEHDEREVEIP